MRIGVGLIVSVAAFAAASGGCVLVAARALERVEGVKTARFTTMDDELLVHAEDRKRLKGAYKALFEEASAILFRHDPIGLDFETNIDEYDPEARTILPRLASCGSAEDVQRVVHEEFSRWFAPHPAGPAERYEAPARELWALWQRHQQLQSEA